MRDTWGSFKGLHTWSSLADWAYCLVCLRTRHEAKVVKGLFKCPGRYVSLDECGQPEPEPPKVKDLLGALEESLAATKKHLTECARAAHGAAYRCTCRDYSDS